ncbi:MAG: HAD family phosphatase [Candidatus Diapherotrites archaeon]|nr:HAD family phosphatase [Candidatus Diapherotrites archaeon]
MTPAKKASRKPKAKIKLVCFDFDNTLVDFTPHISSWGLLSEKLGVLEKVKLIQNDFLDGKIPYSEWPLREAKLWIEKGVSRKELLEHLKKAKAMKNSLKVLKKLKARGIKLALVSGSLDFAFEVFFPKSLFDHVITERAVFNEKEKLERVELFCALEKLAHVKNIAKFEGLKMEEIAFVGDGGNDIEAIKAVGLGIAFNPHVKELENAAKIVIKEKDYNRLLEVIL